MDNEKTQVATAILMDGTRVPLYERPPVFKNRPVLHMENPKLPYMLITGNQELIRVQLVTSDYTETLATKTNGKGKTALEHAVTFVEKYGKQNRIYEYKIDA